MFFWSRFGRKIKNKRKLPFARKRQRGLMGDINFRAITWHGLLWQQKGNYICNQRQEWQKIFFFTPYVPNHNSNTIFCSWNCLDLVSLTKRNIAMMSKPKKTCWVKKAGGKLKRKKGKLSSSKFLYRKSFYFLHIFLCRIQMCVFCGWVVLWRISSN